MPHEKTHEAERIPDARERTGLAGSGGSDHPAGSPGSVSVLAIDPGEKAGYAWGGIAADGHLTLGGHGIEHLKRFSAQLDEWFASDYSRPDVVVVEWYRISGDPQKLKAHIGSDVPTLQMIGYIRAKCWRWGVTLVKQHPKDKTQAAVCAPDVIRAARAGLPLSHDESHDGDALLHLGLYWWRNHFDPTGDPS